MALEARRTVCILIYRAITFADRLLLSFTADTNRGNEGGSF